MIVIRSRGTLPLLRRCRSTIAATAAAPDAVRTNTSQESAKPYNEMPGPRILPVIGTSWTFLPIFGYQKIDRLQDGFATNYRRFGPIWREVFPGSPDRVMLCDPEDVEKVFRAENQYPIRPGLRCFEKYRQKRPHWFPTLGLVLLQAKEWQSFRSRVQQPMMKPKNATVYITGMEDVVNDFITRIRQRRNAQMEVPGDFQNELYKWALESISLVALDARIGCMAPSLAKDSEPQVLIDAVSTSFDCMMKMEMRVPWWLVFPTKTWRTFVKVQDAFATIAMKYIQQSIERGKDRSEDDQPTLLQLFLNKQKLLPEEALVMANDMMMGGVDTTSHSSAFTLYHLSQHPDKQERLYEEVKRALPSKDDPITPALINEMKYLKACVKESLRLTPVVIGIPRMLSNDMVLSGYQVPKGTSCMAIGQLITQLEEHFPNPKSYIPERWLRDTETATKANPFTYMPFGNGARTCIGRRFAEQEMYILLSKLIRNFRVEYKHTPIDFRTTLVNIPDQPLRFKFIDR